MTLSDTLRYLAIERPDHAGALEAQAIALDNALAYVTQIDNSGDAILAMTREYSRARRLHNSLCYPSAVI